MSLDFAKFVRAYFRNRWENGTHIEDMRCLGMNYVTDLMSCSSYCVVCLQEF